MPHWFSTFPRTDYVVETATYNVQNITIGIALHELLASPSTIYYNYDVKDSDRPDIIADKYYDDPTLDWIILLTNKIHNPLFDWPLTYQNFNEYIKNKYGDIPTALAEVHHYNQIIQQQQVLPNGTVIPKRTLIVDQTTYDALPASERELIHSFDYENDLNEQRRKIRIIDREFVETILQQHETVIQ